jgi:tetratricopeptide (TPR) repeat protein
LELDPNFQPAYILLSTAYWLKGDYAQSVEARAKALDIIGETQNAALVREAYAKGGWTAYLRLVAQESIVPGTPVYGIATYYAALGEKDEAFAALNKSLENRETLLAQIKVDPRMDPLRTDPRFQELVQRLGFK